jgi:hypothetical protein
VSEPVVFEVPELLHKVRDALVPEVSEPVARPFDHSLTGGGFQEF